jgi:ankyrin repeat protein
MNAIRTADKVVDLTPTIGACLSLLQPCVVRHLDAIFSPDTSQDLHDLAARSGVTSIVKKLVKRGVVIHAQSHKGQTPLHMAQREQYREVVEFVGGTYEKRWWW